MKQKIKNLTELYPSDELMETILTKGFEDSNKEVYNCGTDIRFSGSTCVSMITYGKKLYTANVGDSRAILIRAQSSGCLGIPITRDHKPEDPIEAKTILEADGRIDSYRD
jgi:serine/threonine protein phosphatase PrpC